MLACGLDGDYWVTQEQDKHFLHRSCDGKTGDQSSVRAFLRFLDSGNCGVVRWTSWPRKAWGAQWLVSTGGSFAGSSDGSSGGIFGGG